MSEWIPTKGPNGRLPTEEDAVTCGDNFRVTFKQMDGSVVFLGWKRWNIISDPDRIVAWMPDSLPAPYVPLEPEKPKRRHFKTGAGYEMGEVLPGDPSIDGALQVREEMRGLCDAGCVADGDDMAKWLKLLEANDGE